MPRSAVHDEPSEVEIEPHVDLTTEASLLDSGHRLVGGVDEVGRGAWAGPLLVGVVVVDATTAQAPDGTRDSKALTPKRRRALRPELEDWCVAWALGAASAREIDRLGLTRALRLAASRAVVALPRWPTALIVDGPVDFLSKSLARRGQTPPLVQPIIGADDLCASVAAASVLAKVARDTKMSALGHRFPRYGFDQHKGYGTREHARAIAAHGLTAHHRQTWSFVEREDPEGVCD
jgi:ribonuclease HII